MPTSWRSDVAAGLFTMLTDFRTANPTYLHNVYRSRPKTFNDRPLAFVGSRNEPLIEHTSGIRRRTSTPQVVIVYAARDYTDEMADIRDDVVDAFLDFATARPHAISATTLVEPRATEDVELALDDAYYPATVVTFAAVIQEGRA